MRPRAARQDGGAGARAQVLEWDVSARGLRLKFRGGSGLTVPRRPPRLAETAGRFVLREIGMDPDNPDKPVIKEEA